MSDKLDKIIKQSISENISIKSKILNSNLVLQIKNTGLLMYKCLQKGGKIIFAGNGGSFSDSQHLAAEFIGRFQKNRRPLPAITLGSNNSSISAIGNDFGYKYVFSRELSVLASKKDIFIPISTSGRSQNLIEALKVADKLGLKSIAMTGYSGGYFINLCECIKVPSTSTPRIQECHILIGHILCNIVEEKL